MTVRHVNEGRIVLFFFHCLLVTDDRNNDVVELFTLPRHSRIGFEIVLKNTHVTFIDTFAHVLAKVNRMKPSKSRGLAHEVGVVNIFLMLENQSKFLASLFTRINRHPD